MSIRDFQDRHSIRDDIAYAGEFLEVTRRLVYRQDFYPATALNKATSVYIEYLEECFREENSV